VRVCVCRGGGASAGAECWPLLPAPAVEGAPGGWHQVRAAPGATPGVGRLAGWPVIYCALSPAQAAPSRRGCRPHPLARTAYRAAMPPTSSQGASSARCLVRVVREGKGGEGGSEGGGGGKHGGCVAVQVQVQAPSACSSLAQA
jgi:hypothetical protein